MTTPVLTEHQSQKTANTFGFAEKLIEGEAGEKFIADVLSKFGKVQRVSDMGFQNVGIDAFFISDRYGYTSFQFKRCSRAKTSGNAFLEIAILNERREQTSLGWALKTTAQSVAYWAVGTGKLYLIDTMAVKRVLPSWRTRFRTAHGCSRENGRTWYGEGLCVPLSVLEREVCTDVITVEEV